ncbi:MAG: hypothetical protein ACI3XF_05955, partial [Eubacteriales bacterium]
VFSHSFIDTTRANTSHERIEQIRVCVGSTPAYKRSGGRVWSLCADRGKGMDLCRIGMAQSKVEQTTRAFEPVSCLSLRSDGLLDMFAQEGVYCSRFGKVGIDRQKQTDSTAARSRRAIGLKENT